MMLMVGITIIEKNVKKPSGPNCSLIHYLLVHPDVCNQHIGTAMLIIIMRKRDYVDRTIIAMTLIFIILLLDLNVLVHFLISLGFVL